MGRTTVSGVTPKTVNAGDSGTDRSTSLSCVSPVSAGGFAAGVLVGENGFPEPIDLDRPAKSGSDVSSFFALTSDPPALVKTISSRLNLWLTLAATPSAK